MKTSLEVLGFFLVWDFVWIFIWVFCVVGWLDLEFLRTVLVWGVWGGFFMSFFPKQAAVTHKYSPTLVVNIDFILPNLRF